jgi:hypothetical protein
MKFGILGQFANISPFAILSQLMMGQEYRELSSPVWERVRW